MKILHTVFALVMLSVVSHAQESKPERPRFSSPDNKWEFRFDSINLDRPEVVYQVISGAPSGTYIFLAPLPSLRMMDNGRPFTPTYAEGSEAAARKKAADTEIVRQHLWFRIEPRMSYVSEEFASPDPGFWHPTPR